MLSNILFKCSGCSDRFLSCLCMPEPPSKGSSGRRGIFYLLGFGQFPLLVQGGILLKYWGTSGERGRSPSFPCRQLPLCAHSLLRSLQFKCRWQQVFYTLQMDILSRTASNAVSNINVWMRCQFSLSPVTLAAWTGRLPENYRRRLMQVSDDAPHAIVLPV